MSQIRNSWVTKNWETNSFLDAASWEAVRRRGDGAIKAWIDRQLSGTGVTVILVGNQTARRRYVLYEIEESHKRGNGLVAIYIHGMKDQHGKKSRKGRNPLEDFTTEVKDPFFGIFTYHKKLSEIYASYDWVGDDGYRNMGRWIEDAARKAGR